MIKRILASVVFLSLFVSGALAQTGQITGKITDTETGNVLPGVNVVLSEINQGAATNAKGVFTIGEVPVGTYTLRASFVGYQAYEAEVTIEEGEVVTHSIELQPGAVGLDEVVVTGYGTQQEAEISGSISSVSADEIQNVPAQNAQQLLQGRAAGVTLTSTSGNPGGGFEVNIRGEGSINAGNEPLYIVDGVQLSTNQGSALTDRSPLNAISPGNIESIEVLKDAAAASIYGAQAANGVVLITTKSGQQGDVQTTIDFEGGIRTPHWNHNPLSPQEWIDMNVDVLGENVFRAGYLPLFGYAPDTPFSELRRYDWEEYISRTGAHRKVGFSANGGGETTQFFLSGNWSNTEGAVRAVAYESYNFRANFTQELTPSLNIDSKLTVSNQDQPGVCQDGFFINCPFSAIQFAVPISYPYLDNGDYNPNQSIFGLNNNPAVVLNEEERSVDVTQIIGSISPTYQINSWLRLNGQLGIDWSQRRDVDHEPPIADPGAGGSTYTSDQTITNLTTNLRLNANRTFGDVHNVSAFIGSEYRREFETNNAFSVEGFGNPFLSVPSAGTQSGGFGGANTEFRLLSLLGSVDYNFDDRYILTLSGRYDGSSRFGANQRWGLFPSAALAWRISQEEFFTFDSVDELKLRLSYGITGNSGGGNFDNFAARGLYNISGSYLGQSGIAPGQLANPQLTWEEKRSINVGLDWGMWNNRFTGTLDLYRETSSELLLGRPLPVSSGYGSILGNVGEVQNRGIEVSFQTVNIQTQSFRWSTRFTAGLNQNEVLELTGDQQELNGGGALPIAVGYSQEAWHVPRWAGVNPADGRPMFYDENGNITYFPDQADDVFFDGGEEDVSGGFGTRLNYQGLSLDVFFQYSYGATALPNTERAFLGNQSVFSSGLSFLTRRWQEPGEVTDVPYVPAGGVYPNSSGFNTLSTYWLYDASYLRLKSATLSYSLPSNLAEKVSLSGARIYVSGANLITWTSYLGLDPEVAGAFSESSYPSERQLNVGIELDL